MKNQFIVSKKITKTSLLLVQKGFKERFDPNLDFNSKLIIYITKNSKIFSVKNKKRIKLASAITKIKLSKTNFKEIEKWTTK